MKPNNQTDEIREKILALDKKRQTHQIDNSEYIDKLIKLFEEHAKKYWGEGYHKGADYAKKAELEGRIKEGDYWLGKMDDWLKRKEILKSKLQAQSEEKE